MFQEYLGQPLGPYGESEPRFMFNSDQVPYQLFGSNDHTYDDAGAEVVWAPAGYRKLSTPNPEPCTLSHKPYTLNPKP